MTKRIFVCAFVIEDEKYSDGDPPDKFDIALHIDTTFGRCGAVTGLTVWDSLEALNEDVAEIGPLTVEALENEDG